MLSAANVRNQTPLMTAVQTGDEETVRAVVEFIGDEVRTTVVPRYPTRPEGIKSSQSEFLPYFAYGGRVFRFSLGCSCGSSEWRVFHLR